MNIASYAVGWIVFVLVQAQNSIKSKSNGLAGTAGFNAWFKAHAIDLVFRAFLAAVFYGFVLDKTAAQLTAIGLSASAYGIAGLGGFGSNAILYQVSGLIPWLRVETSEVAPPPAVPPKE